MVELFSSLNFWAVFVATLLYFVLGALWYSVIFAKTWMKFRGVTEEQIGEPNPVIFLWTFILQLIAVFSLALFLQAMGVGTVLHGAVIGFGAGAGIVFTLTGSTGLFSDAKLGLHLIDNGYHVLGLIIAGAVLGMWQ